MKLVPGLIYIVRIGDDVDEDVTYRAMYLRDVDGNRLLACWFVYDYPPGSDEVKLTAAKSVTPLRVDVRHAADVAAAGAQAMVNLVRIADAAGDVSRCHAGSVGCTSSDVFRADNGARICQGCGFKLRNLP